MIFPWQHNEWQQCLRAEQENRLPHAILLTGIPGIGKTRFAEALARQLLCQASGLAECTCHGCRLVLSRAHPDVFWVEAEKAGQAIKVDQIRALSDFINQSSFQGEYRLAIIHPADNMNASAANALLKTLEEPAPGSLLLLINHQLNALPATVLSRCQRLLFPRPARALALEWLKAQLKDSSLDANLLLNLAQGAPLKALQLLEDERLAMRKSLLDAICQLNKGSETVLQSAANFAEGDTLLQIDFLLSFLLDLVRLQLGDVPAEIKNTDFLPTLTELKENMLVKNTMHLMAYLQQLRGQILSGFNLNKQLMMENIFIRWMECH